MNTGVWYKPSYRRPLNGEQVAILELLYKFRFASSSHIAQYFNRTSSQHLYKRLKILEAQELIGKRYDSSYRLRGKPAAYYLTPKGARLLKTKSDTQIEATVIKNFYKNKTVSEDFIAHCFSIFSLYVQLRTQYNNQLRFFTRSQLVPFDYLPAWLPDAYIQLDAKGEGKRFFLDIFDGAKPFFVIVKKARNYLSYSEEGDWKSQTTTDLPAVLMICQTERNERKLRRQIRKALDESYEEVRYATTTMDALMNAKAKQGRAWRLWDDEDALYSLDGI